MNKIKVIGTILLNLLMQATLFSRIQVAGATPNLTIPVVVGLAMIFGSNAGGYAGMVIGLLEEVMFSNVIGVRALIYFLLGYWIGKNNYSFSRADIRTGMIFTALATAINFLFTSLIYYVLGMRTEFLRYLAGPIFVEILMNVIVFAVLIRLFQKIFVVPSFRY